MAYQKSGLIGVQKAVPQEQPEASMAKAKTPSFVT
jgi:hypothetical protein